MQTLLSERWIALTERLDGVGDWLAPLGLRLVLAWEFWEAGIEKFRGQNWFGGIQSDFPFPFDRVPPDLSWAMATWFELGGAIALLLGLGTRFFAFNLFVLTMVATASVHWPMDWQTLRDLAMGYAISDKGFGNFKLPLIFAAALLSFAHGANDVANAIGPLSAIVHAAQDHEISGQVTVPLWVMVIGAAGISLGLLLFGPRLIRLVGEQIDDLVLDEGRIDVHHHQPLRPAFQTLGLDGHIERALGRCGEEHLPNLVQITVGDHQFVRDHRVAG